MLLLFLQLCNGFAERNFVGKKTAHPNLEAKAN